MEFVVKVHFTIEAQTAEQARQHVWDTLGDYPEFMDEIPGLIAGHVDNVSEVTLALSEKTNP